MKKRSRSWKTMLFPPMTHEEYEKIRDTIDQGNGNALRTYSLLSSVYMLLMIPISMVLPGFRNYTMLYVGSFLALCVVFLLAKLLLPKRPHLSDPLICLFLLVINTFGLLMGAILNAGQVIVTFVAILLLETVPFTDIHLHLKLVTLVSMIACTVICLFTKEISILETDLVNIWIYGSIGLMGGVHTTRIHLQTDLAEYRIRVISETDELTGLKNRNCYARRLTSYSTCCAHSLSCTYIDANGLHELNNSSGHEAGDRMLCFIASALQNAFGSAHAYRIGGDEFVVFAPDTAYEQAVSLIASIAETCQNEGYHISVGTAHLPLSGGQLDINSLILTAEQRMYANKAQYYARIGRTPHRGIPTYGTN